jgi:hypothetical protein
MHFLNTSKGKNSRGGGCRARRRCRRIDFFFAVALNQEIYTLTHNTPRRKRIRSISVCVCEHGCGVWSALIRTLLSMHSLNDAEELKKRAKWVWSLLGAFAPTAGRLSLSCADDGVGNSFIYLSRTLIALEDPLRLRFLSINRNHHDAHTKTVCTSCTLFNLV